MRNETFEGGKTALIKPSSVGDVFGVAQSSAELFRHSNRVLITILTGGIWRNEANLIKVRKRVAFIMLRRNILFIWERYGAVLVSDAIEKLLRKNVNKFSRTVAHHIKFQRKHKERNRVSFIREWAFGSINNIGVWDGAKGADYCALLSIGQH